MQARQKKQGFTLIELLIVIAIIGLLATLAIVSLTTAQRKARDTKRIADIKQLQNAVELYYSENGSFPDSGGTTVAWSDFGGLITAYITNVPIDPTNATDNSVDYVYTYGTSANNDEYFIGAQLEDSSHDALSGDDDIAYTVGTTPGNWTGLDVVDSNDTSTATAVASFDCSVARTYCTSE